MLKEEREEKRRSTSLQAGLKARRFKSCCVCRARRRSLGSSIQGLARQGTATKGQACCVTSAQAKKRKLEEEECDDDEDEDFLDWRAKSF